jgi:hypothetical protein
MPQLGNIKP